MHETIFILKPEPSVVAWRTNSCQRTEQRKGYYNKPNETGNSAGTFCGLFLEETFWLFGAILGSTGSPGGLGWCEMVGEGGRF